MKRKIFLATVMLLVLAATFGLTTSAYASEGETRYADAPLLSLYASETINYTRREITAENYTDGNCPFYYPLSDLSNSCGSVAGAEIVAFYDKYYPNLIPDWVSYYTATGKYRLQNSTYVAPLIRDLYTRMRTNVDDVGVSESDFLNGLKNYINANGYQVSYQNIKSGNTINFEQCKNAIDNNKVIALLTLPTTVYEMSEGVNRDTFNLVNISGAHIMVVFGYLQIKYYNTSGLFRTDTYLAVAVGQVGHDLAYYRIDSTATQAAYIVNIQ